MFAPAITSELYSPGDAEAHVPVLVTVAPAATKASDVVTLAMLPELNVDALVVMPLGGVKLTAPAKLPKAHSSTVGAVTADTLGATAAVDEVEVGVQDGPASTPDAVAQAVTLADGYPAVEEPVVYVNTYESLPVAIL